MSVPASGPEGAGSPPGRSAAESSTPPHARPASGHPGSSPGPVAAEAGLPRARAAAERAARSSYGRLVALLAAPTGDLALAEDAVAGAFEEALRRWPETGVPANPEGWLLTVARNRRRDVWKSAAYRTAVPLEEDSARFDPLAGHNPDAIGDRRLCLAFPGPGKFVAEKKLVRVKAAPAPSCPAEP